MTPSAHSSTGRTTQALLRRFRSQRPLRAGSLLVTIFGDAIAPRGAAVTLGGLIELARPFGLTERLVRTSVGRLAQDGWLTARRQGRRSEYRLTAGGKERFAEATHRIYGRNPLEWDGHWLLVLLPELSAERRTQLRDELLWLGLGQIRAGVYARPGGDGVSVGGQLRRMRVSRSILLRAASQGIEDDRRLVAAGWDLEDLARRYQRFVTTFGVLAGSDLQAARPQEAFVIRTLLIHEYRRIHLRDPLLPPALLPVDWIGTTAYELCAALYARVFTAAERFLSDTAATLNAPLPDIEAAACQRFGGVGARSLP